MNSMDCAEQRLFFAAKEVYLMDEKPGDVLTIEELSAYLRIPVAKPMIAHTSDPSVDAQKAAIVVREDAASCGERNS